MRSNHRAFVGHAQFGHFIQHFTCDQPQKVHALAMVGLAGVPVLPLCVAVYTTGIGAFFVAFGWFTLH